jgi:hypothetical protein
MVDVEIALGHHLLQVDLREIVRTDGLSGRFRLAE